MTFADWQKANAKYMEPADIVAWCAEAWMAGFDEAVRELGTAIEEGDPQTIADVWLHQVKPMMKESDK